MLNYVTPKRHDNFTAIDRDGIALHKLDFRNLRLGKVLGRGRYLFTTNSNQEILRWRGH